MRKIDSRSYSEVKSESNISEVTNNTWFTLIEKGKLPAALTFAGQGAVDIRNLTDWYRNNSQLREYIQLADEVINRVVKSPETLESGLFESGFELKRWLQNPSEIPSQSYLLRAEISQPLIFMDQVLRYVLLRSDGMFEAFSPQNAPLSTGHSQGMMAALLISETDDGSIPLDRFGQYILYLTWQGFEMARIFKFQRRGQEPTPMASISGPHFTKLEKLLSKWNRNLPTDRQLHISLYNTPNRCVISGYPEVLEEFQKFLTEVSKKETALKNSGKLAGSPLSFSWEYLDVGGPYHSPKMAPGIPRMLSRMRELKFDIDGTRLYRRVLSPHSGKPYNRFQSLLEEIVTDQFTRNVDWKTTVHTFSTEVKAVLDLGPGDGVARLTRSLLRGKGVAVFPLATPEGRNALLNGEYREPLNYEIFAPKVRKIFVQSVKDSNEDKESSRAELTPKLDNRYSRFTGYPPVFIGGMTPTTAEVPIVAGALNAGFMAELAGGGQVNEKIFWRRMDELAEKLQPGRETVFNALFLDPYLWDLHIRKKALLLRAKRAGYPICGVTISAGVPDVDEAKRLLDLFLENELWLNSFKPGTVRQIDQVIAIAKAAPEHTFLVQIEGGKAGGHHSWESLDDLLLQRYHRLRELPNLIICAGGGIHSPRQATQLLTGQWSEKYGVGKMPLDAVFIGTAVMASREAGTSPQVKQLLAQIAGTDEWVFSGEFKGGLTSGKSSLDADIYYIENSASRCAKLLDQVAGKPEEVKKRRSEIIRALEKTAKPYFGDLEKMTYLQVSERMVQLMAVGNGSPYEDGVWPDESYRLRVFDWLRRSEARLHSEDEGTFSPVISSPQELDDPQRALKKFAEAYPSAAKELLHPSDVKFFIEEICKRPGKPVNFVPVIDENVRRWYKSDSLWQSHNPRYSADQVLIVPGPAGIKGIQKPDEPVGEILNRFYRDIAENSPSLRELEIPATFEVDEEEFPHTQIAKYPDRVEFTILEEQPSRPNISRLGRLVGGILGEFISSPRIFTSDNSSIINPLWRLWRWSPGSAFAVHLKDGKPHQITYWPHSDERTERASASLTDGENIALTLQLAPIVSGQPASSLNIEFRYSPSTRSFHVDRKAWRKALQEFYAGALLGERLEPVALFQEARDTVSAAPEKVEAYLRLVGEAPEPSEKTVPIPMAFSLVWRPILRILLSEEFVEGIIDLLHLENKISIGPGWPVKPGEKLTATARVVEVESTPEGKGLRVKCRILRKDELCAEVDTKFWIRGNFEREEKTYQKKDNFTVISKVNNNLELFYKIPYIRWNKELPLSSSDILKWEISIEEERRRGGELSFSARGTVKTESGELAGEIEFSASGDKDPGQPVFNLLSHLRGEESWAAIPHQNPGTVRFEAPKNMRAFALAGGDLNPIHRSTLFARWAGFEEPIVHGMWTAARLSAIASNLEAKGKFDRIGKFDVQFLAPVELGERLECQLRRRGARGGAVSLDLEVSAVRSAQKVTAARGELVISPPKTAYAFPGQGIQRPGMGMEAFSKSPVARDVWERADRFTRQELGFSVLEIVRNNPKALSVGGKLYVHPKGVLYLTQFTQVSMAVLAQAQMAQLREAGLAVEDAIACGHSLGEYNALASVSQVLPLESVLALVYQRGLVMHNLVERDRYGESGYRLVAAMPHRAGINHSYLTELIEKIRENTGEFIQIVNFNVRNRQYVVAGKIEAIRALEEHFRTQLTFSENRPPLVEVPGIDVPFHSEVLRPGVAQFREALRENLPSEISPELLEGKYIPNLLAEPFTLEREFVQKLAEATDFAPETAALLENYSEKIRKPKKFAREILIELLAWQFASPVRWIETQELMFKPRSEGGLGVERMVEIGVGYQPTVANMARQTLFYWPGPKPETEVLNFEADFEKVFYLHPIKSYGEFSDAPVQADSRAETKATGEKESREKPSENREDTKALPSQEEREFSPAPGGDSTASSLPEHPVSTEEALLTLIALQAKVRPEQIQKTESIDDILGGVSSKRNQLLIDLKEEFKVEALDGANEKPVGELAEELAKRASSYRFPGAYLGAALERRLYELLGPAGWDAQRVAEYWGKKYGFSESIVQTGMRLLLLETRSGDSVRGGPLGQLPSAPLTDNSSVEKFLDGAAKLVGTFLGVQVRPIASGGGKAAIVDATALRELEEKLLGPDGIITEAAEKLLRHSENAERSEKLSREFRELKEQLRQKEEELSHWKGELGEEFQKLTAPKFDPKKAVSFTSQWAFLQRDLAQVFFELSEGKTSEGDLFLKLRQLAHWRSDSRLQKAVRWFADRATERSRPDIARLLQGILFGEIPRGVFVEIRRPELKWDDSKGWNYREVPDPEFGSNWRAWVHFAFSGRGKRQPLLQLNSHLRGELRNKLESGLFPDDEFAGETVLLTGAGPGSIAASMLKFFLLGGARVVVTTSTYRPERLKWYKSIYRKWAAPGAELHVVPFNQASFRDIDQLVEWLFKIEIKSEENEKFSITKHPLIPTIIVPFGAIKDLAALPYTSGRSEAALRSLLTGVERLLGQLALKFAQRGKPSEPVLALLPLSPNKGDFGGDGYYAEAKAGLEVLLRKWKSEYEAWGRYFALCGAEIGWVRGTGLMDENNALAALLEKETDIYTFSSDEMGLLLTLLSTEPVRREAAKEPVRADLSAGFSSVKEFSALIDRLSRKLEERGRRKKRLQKTLREVTPPAECPASSQLKALPNWPVTNGSLLERSGLLDSPEKLEREWGKFRAPLEEMVVIVGFGELGPCGTSRTRLFCEWGGELPASAVIELAWMMGLVQYRADGKPRWIDAETGEEVPEEQLASRYRERVLAGIGIREIGENNAPFDPKRLTAWSKFFLEKPLKLTVSNRETAEALNSANGGKGKVSERNGKWELEFPTGSEVRLPKRYSLDRTVAGMLPDGFSPERFGVPAEMVESVDPVSIYNLISTADAFSSAGLEPEELLESVHPARVANVQGSGIGGMRSLQRLYLDPAFDRERQPDVLQESLINVMGAYAVQSYVGSYGPMLHPVAACATAAVSVEAAVSKLLSREVDFAVAGGFDDIGPNGMIGFKDMNATASTEEMLAKGLEPSQFSRPNDSRRGGFVEAHGGGAFLLTRGDVAFELGLPVYGVVAYGGSFGDGLHTSIPAPGLGALASALGGENSPLNRALAKFGMTADDIGAVSKHDTSTQANDPNEARLHFEIQRALNRTAGNPLFVISQKSLTGHPKGGAAAWQLAGLCHAMLTGKIPGNANLDDADQSLKELYHLALSDETLQLPESYPLRAALLTSLGFGHVNALLLVLNPAVYYASIDREKFDSYAQKVRERIARERRFWAEVIMGLRKAFSQRTDRRVAGLQGEIELLTDSRQRFNPEKGRFEVVEKSSKDFEE